MIDFIFNSAYAVLDQILTWLVDFFADILGGTPRRKTILEADFANEQDLLSTDNKGFCLTGKRALTIKESHMHSLVLGGSGSGKTVSVLIPTIYNVANGGSSMVIHDPSGELMVTSGYLEKLGYKIKVLQYARPEISEGYNPLSRAISQSDIQKIASMLVRNTLGTGGDNAFWNNQSQALLSLIFSILKKQPIKFQNLRNAKYILDMMQANPTAMDILVANCKDDYILSEYKNFIATEKRVLANVISSCRAAMILYNDKSVGTVTAFDSFSFEEFTNSKVVLYIQNSTSDIQYYATLTSIFTEQFFGHIMSKIPEKNARSIFFLLDEASSLYIPSMSIAVSNLRKFSCGVMLVGQDYQQFENIYNPNDAQAIKTNMYTRIHFSGGSLKMCQELSSLLGQYEYVEEGTGKRRQRKLMEPDEIRTMGKSTLIFCGSKPAIHIHKMLPYYEHPQYKKYSKIPPPELKNKVPFSEIPMIAIPTS